MDELPGYYLGRKRGDFGEVLRREGLEDNGGSICFSDKTIQGVIAVIANGPDGDYLVIKEAGWSDGARVREARSRLREDARQFHAD